MDAGEVTFYKFRSDASERPNERQRRICEMLKVPSSLWSFFRLKKEYIRRCWKGHKFEIFGIEYEESDETLVNNFDYSEYGDMDLTFEEKFFVYHNEDILLMQRDYICVNYSASSLRNLCVNSVGSNHSLPVSRGSLPETVAEDVAEKSEVRMPEYDREGMRGRYFDEGKMLNDLLAETEPVVSKDFAVWFQNEDSIGRLLDLSSVKVVCFYFLASESRTLELCRNCVGWRIRNGELGGMFQRVYYDARVYVQGRELRHMIAYLQSPANWCHGCKRVPLFRFVNDEEFERRYGEYKFFRPLEIETYI